MSVKKRPDAEEPISVKRNPWGRSHPTETRIFRREIHETFCADPKCKFFGKRAAQGVCHTKIGEVSRYIDLQEKGAEESLAWYRKQYRGKPKEYVRFLESWLLCSEMNEAFTMDELVRLRAENALYKVRAGKWDKKESGTSRKRSVRSGSAGRRPRRK